MADELPEHVRRGLVRGPVPVPERLLASWQRSQEYGVSAETVDPVFSGTYDRESLFFECGREVLTGLHATLGDEPISLMLTDSEGLVLNRLSSDGALLRALDEVHLAPGFAFSEREAGTNGLALALADRVPVVVHAEQHYSAGLCGYTCAAVPVLDPLSGRLEGSVNLTTWSQSSSALLLALAQSAAGNTSALMLARSRGRTPRPQPRGEVFRVQTATLEPGSGSLLPLSAVWAQAVAETVAALSAGHVVAAVGEPGSGRATLTAQAQRQVHPRDRILSASPPDPQDLEAWLALWTPELGKAHTGVIVCDVDTLPLWGAQRLREIIDVERARRDAADQLSLVLTAEELHAIPAVLGSLAQTVVRVPALRERTEDVVPLARHIARRARGREVSFSRTAEDALRDCAWPGNVDQLGKVIRAVAQRTDAIDVQHLPAEVLSRSGHRLSRLETLEREEIIRVLNRPGLTVAGAAAELGMSRATVYRKLSQYGLRAQGRSRRRSG